MLAVQNQNAGSILDFFILTGMSCKSLGNLHTKDHFLLEDYVKMTFYITCTYDITLVL